MNPYESLGHILGLDPFALERIDRAMAARTGRIGVMAHVAMENDDAIRRTLNALGLHSEDPPATEVKAALRRMAITHADELGALLKTVEGRNEFEQAANLARKIARVGKGFFLKKGFGREILHASKPEHLLQFLGAKDVDELLAKHDVTEIFSALRFIESDEWMHGTFERAYSKFTAADFEERDIEIRVLGSEWQEVAKKFVAKKHHNVSHLKEFGVIFLNPVREDAPGKYLRDFALLFHYFHEIEFYAKLFRLYAPRPDFATHLKSLLRGDVQRVANVPDGTWLIVQRYLSKEDPNDPRLRLPRINPESVHWLRGERDLTNYGLGDPKIDWEFWADLDWVGGVLPGGMTTVSFDLEDNIMSAVSFLDGKDEYLNYHQREALWTRLFIEYADGESEMEKLLIENFDKGQVEFTKMINSK